MGKKMIYAEVTAGEDCEPSVINISSGKGSRVTLIANTHRTIVRVADLSGRDKRLTAATQWRLVQENFPLGPQLNEDTHIFDGGMFTNAVKRSIFLMVALPKAIAEPIAEMGIEKWGSAHKLRRLDTVEHVLFRHYANAAKKTAGKGRVDTRTDTEPPQSLWVVFPQDLGYRILFMKDGLPHSAHYISNHPEMRDTELDRVWEAAAPDHVVILTRTSGDGEVAGDDGLWLREFVQGRGVAVDNEVFNCF